MAADPKPRALELVESGTYGSTPDAPATPHAMNTSPCATLAVRATLAVIVLANVVLVASLLAIGGRYPALVSPGLLALGFGPSTRCWVANLASTASSARGRKGEHLMPGVA